MQLGSSTVYAIGITHTLCNGCCWFLMVLHGFQVRSRGCAAQVFADVCKELPYIGGAIYRSKLEL